MKKTFQLQDPKKVKERHIDALKHEINKYIARERRKTLPEGFDFWDFDSKIGPSAAEVKVIEISEVKKEIDSLAASEHTSFYLEILAKAQKKVKK